MSKFQVYLNWWSSVRYVARILVLNLLCLQASAQIRLPDKYPAKRPYIQTTADPTTLERYRSNVDHYVRQHQKDAEWMVSRLQMYWKTKSTDVFIKGGVYDHAEGKAPVATVRFPGARDHTTIYGNVKLEDLQPYEDDPRGVRMINKSKPDQPVEWADVSKTGRNIESVNTNIMRMAAEAGMLYSQTKNLEYVRFAFDLFDTYMMGMYYRSEPIDLSHGHHQTIVGLSTFEVIQEVAMLGHLTSLYDNLHGYISENAPNKHKLYTETFKKWADLQSKNGVAFNNWNLMQAKNVLMIANILELNHTYPDKKGKQYYINQVMNEDSERQWSIRKVMQEGYDPGTGIWNESAGYSSGVLHDFTGYINWFDRNFNFDLLPQLPVLEKATLAEAEYIFPNGYVTAFGDTYYHQLQTRSAVQLIENARKNGKTRQEDKYTRFIKTIEQHQALSREQKIPVDSTLKASVKAGRIEDYVSPVFSAPNVSYFAQRNGMDPQSGMMVAMTGSKGNHMHANGISMEIYGKGLVLGPDGGIGTSYFQQDYAEYYSQFPAHNTVAVDGISAYPVMKSNHGFEVLSCYPASGQKKQYFPKVTFGELYFLEPETQSDQKRLTSIIRTSDSTGYYLDVFRSKRRDGKDKMHDYFYHNLGGQLVLSDISGKPLDVKPTEKLSFAGGHLFAYDYFWDKRSVTTNQDYNATFKVQIPGRDVVTMNLWMKGSSEREIFAVKAPASKAFRSNQMIPDSIARLPLSTLVVRQYGEAWNKPFVAVYEPETGRSKRSVTSINTFNPANVSADFVGLEVKSRGGIQDFIFSSSAAEPVSYNRIDVKASFAIARLTDKYNINYLFLGKGDYINCGQFRIRAGAPVTAVFYVENNNFYYLSDQPTVLTLPDYAAKAEKFFLRFTREGNETVVEGKRVAGTQNVEYNMPAMAQTQLFLTN
ncbi:hypothetical protein DSL64_13585 [Dyadobacter luteus]|uniref:Six-hairpin glycosidase n=1 Tax=Dyadobacter luteus TaxID=2259619 RepID=A0A3D8YBS0_9BACT|nr:heparinase II/III family protein [Dyadobacter luteus]REA60928.1 hypothetical protein DSL64_13585 [Dyadobacter luteus]